MHSVLDVLGMRPSECFGLLEMRSRVVEPAPARQPGVHSVQQQQLRDLPIERLRHPSL